MKNMYDSPRTERTYQLLRDGAFETGVSRNLVVATIASACIGVLFVCVLFAFSFHYRHTIVFKAASPPFLYSILFGCSLLYVTIVLMSLDVTLSSSLSTLTYSCRALPFLLSFGFVLSVASLLVKSYRTVRIFNSNKLRATPISNRRLACVVLVLLGVDAVLNAIWLHVDPLTAHLTALNETTDVVVCSCASTNHFIFFYGMNVADKSLLLLSGVLIAWQSAAIPEPFSETKAIALCVYAISCVALVCVPLGLMVDDRDAKHLVKAVGIW